VYVCLIVVAVMKDDVYGVHHDTSTRGGSSKLIERGSYRVKGAHLMSRARGDNHVRISEYFFRNFLTRLSVLFEIKRKDKYSIYIDIMKFM